MNDLLVRLCATSVQPSRTVTEPTPPCVRVLLHEIVIDERGMIEAYRELSDLAEQSAEDIWTGSCPRMSHDFTPRKCLRNCARGIDPR